MSDNENRRKADRVSGDALSRTVRVRLRAGAEARVVNASRLGALIESASRLLPGHRCTVQWQGTGRTSVVPGRIVRSEVARLEADHVAYHGAIEFERTLEDTWEASTRNEHDVPDDSPHTPRPPTRP
jgi:hypothetical protein